MLLDPWCTINRLFRSQWLWPQGKPESRQPAWLQCSSSGPSCDSELVTQQQWAWGPERAVGRSPSVRQQGPQCHREAGSTKRPNHHSHEGAVHTAAGIHMTHIHALLRQQREAGTLRETPRWVSMAHRWAISESLFSPLTAKADYTGSTAVHSVAQKNWKLLHRSELDSIFQIYTLSPRYILCILNFENKLFISAGLNTTVTHQSVLHLPSFILYDNTHERFLL